MVYVPLLVQVGLCELGESRLASLALIQFKKNKFLLKEQFPTEVRCKAIPHFGPEIV